MLLKISHATVIFFILSFFVFGNCVAQSKEGCCSLKYSNRKMDSVSLKDLSIEFKRLKCKKCDECEFWMSGLHLVMLELGKRLEGMNKVEVKKIMGKPTKKEGNWWVYDWRNGHDYLFFEFINGRASSNWYHAYE